jgi:hypothetical protein
VDPTAPQPEPQPPPLGCDLYCLTCGNNLRGLSGDPVRCPECGGSNPIGVVDVPTDFTAAQVHRLDDDLNMSMVALLIAVPLQACFWGLLLVLRGHALWLGIPAFVPVAYWVAGCNHVRRTCRARPGWMRALVMYHLWRLLQILAGIPFVAALAYAVVHRNDVLRAFWTRIAAAVALSAAAFLLVVLIRWSNARARAPLHRLQRDFAVTAAREEIRRRLTESEP